LESKALLRKRRRVTKRRDLLEGKGGEESTIGGNPIKRAWIRKDNRARGTRVTNGRDRKGNSPERWIV